MQALQLSVGLDKKETAPMSLLQIISLESKEKEVKNELSTHMQKLFETKYAKQN